MNFTKLSKEELEIMAQRRNRSGILKPSAWKAQEELYARSSAICCGRSSYESICMAESGTYDEYCSERYSD